jgi:hypothetical protein
VGGAIARAAMPQQLSLYRALKGGCNQALAAAAERSTAEKDALLDFFGVAIRAAELKLRLDQMRTLVKEVERAGPHPQLRCARCARAGAHTGVTA